MSLPILVATFRRPERVRDILVGCALGLVALAAAGTFAARSRVMPAGDTFNFIQAANFLKRGTYPGDEKRLPLYPALIVAGGVFSDDPVAVARTVSVVAYTLIPVTLYAMGRHLRLPSLPFALLLLLGMAHPVFLGNGIRELADTTFLLFLSLAVLCAISLKRTWPRVVGTGAVFAAVALTRYEGLLGLALLGFFLRLRVPWRTVGAVVLVMLLFMSPWLVLATKTFGRPWNPTYFRCVEDCGYGTRLRDLPSRVYALLDMTGWTTLWKHPLALAKEAQEDPQKKFLPRLAASSAWWASALALVGFVWLLVRRTRRALPLLVSLTAVALSVAWWKLHGRFTVTSLLFYYFLAPAGAAAVWIILRDRLRWRVLRTIALGALLVLLLLLVRKEFSGLYVSAVNRVFSYQGNGYALYQALRALDQETGVVVVRKDYPMAVALFRLPNLQTFRAIFLNFDYPDAEPEQIAVSLATRRPAWVILDDSEFMERLATTLRARGAVASERVYTARRGLSGESEERTVVLELDWNRLPAA